MIGNIVAGLQDPGLVAVGDFESIATVSLTSANASDVTFTSIPGTYKHLQIRGMARTTQAATTINIAAQFNGVTSASYASHWLYGDGSSPTALALTSTTEMYVARTAGDSASANVFGSLVIDILDYADTNKNTTVRSLSGADSNGSGLVMFQSNLFNSTNAITSIKLYGQSGDIKQYSHFALYGIKG